MLNMQVSLLYVYSLYVMFYYYRQFLVCDAHLPYAISVGSQNIYVDSYYAELSVDDLTECKTAAMGLKHIY